MARYTIHHRVVVYSAFAFVLRQNKPMPISDLGNRLNSDFGAEFNRNEIFGALVDSEGRKYFVRSTEYYLPYSARTRNVYALRPEFCAALEGRLLSESIDKAKVAEGIRFFARADKRYRKWFKKSPMQLFGEVANQYSGRK